MDPSGNIMFNEKSNELRRRLTIKSISTRDSRLTDLK